MSAEEFNYSFLDDNFNAAEYINSFLKETKTGDEVRQLQALRKALNNRSNVASEAIKDIVFDHYKHFIETSKEISNLEREIYQLSSLLSEQKSLIENLMEMNGQDKKSSSSASVHSVAINSQNQLHSLMHKMDGVATILNALKENEQILLQAQLVLLNSDTMEPEHPVLMVLLANNLLIGHPSAFASKYPFQLVANHALESLAIVNFKSHDRNAATDSPSKTEHILQFLIFPEQLYVKCDSERQKHEWLDVFEQTKRRHEQEKSLQRQATIRAKRKSILNSIVSSSQKQLANKLGERSSASNGGLESRSALSEKDIQWLNDLSDELQNVITETDWETAVDMLQQWKSCNCRDASINAKFLALERQVVKQLSDDVRRPGSLHGGTRVLSRPVVLLTALGRGTYALDLYLRRRGAFMRSNASELVSEEPLSYVRQISTLFVDEIVDVANEFKHQFNNQPQHYCLVLQYASGELSVLLSMIRRNVFERVPAMTVLAHSWRILTDNCEQLITIGMDFSFEIHRLLTPALTKALQTNFTNMVDSVCFRIQSENWHIYDLESESNLNRFVEEMSDAGLSIDWAVRVDEADEDSDAVNHYRGGGINNSDSDDERRPRFALDVAQSACQFARGAVALARDFALLSHGGADAVEHLLDSFVQMLWCEYLLHLSTAEPSAVHTATARFIVGQVLPLCDQIYRSRSCSDGFIRQILVNKFPTLLKYEKAPSFDEEIANV